MRLERDLHMRLTPRIFPCILLAAAVAAPLATTGCQQQPAPAPAPVASSPAPEPTPANDDATYRRWEADTRREHREMEKRTEEEKRQYEQWRRDHEHDRDRH